jgi:hypothetical protein
MIDEDLPTSIAQMFHDAGHDAVTIGEQGFSGYADDRVWNGIQKEAFLVLNPTVRP